MQTKQEPKKKWKWDMGKNKGRETSKKHKTRFAQHFSSPTEK